MVDDDRAVRDALRRALTLGGYEVHVAEGGETGLAQVAASRASSSTTSTRIRVPSAGWLVLVSYSITI